VNWAFAIRVGPGASRHRTGGSRSRARHFRNKLIALNSLNWVSCVPPSASKVTLGKKFAREAPITSLAAADRTFGLRDVRTAAQHVGGRRPGRPRQWKGPRRLRSRKRRGDLFDQCGDGIFQSRTIDLELGSLRLSRAQLGLRPRVRDSTYEPISAKTTAFAIGRNR
jgi:hypothetical protein